MKQILFVFGLFLIVSCGETTEQKKTAELSTPDQDTLEIFDYNGLKPLLNKADDKTYVVNFWATWCAPCIKELPYFEQLNQNYKDQNVEMLLVSLDFPHLYDKKLKPYIKENNLKARVVAFDDTDQNMWIPAISEKWTGAIPATLIYNKDKREFYERSFNYEELETELKKFIN